MERFVQNGAGKAFCGVVLLGTLAFSGCQAVDLNSTYYRNLAKNAVERYALDTGRVVQPGYIEAMYGEGDVTAEYLVVSIQPKMDNNLFKGADNRYDVVFSDVKISVSDGMAVVADQKMLNDDPVSWDEAFEMYNIAKLSMIETKEQMGG